MNFAEKAISYFNNLRAPGNLLPGIEILNPYKEPEVKNIVGNFYSKFFADQNKRIFILGINPGRFGGGITGISFTDPVALREYCGIENKLGSTREISSKFIYKAIEFFGGVKRFFSLFYLSALYPYALLKDGKNYNFYDEKNLYMILRKEMTISLQNQIEFGAKNNAVICLGKKNAQYLKEINNEIKYFNDIRILEHPRYIMQYRMKNIEKYLSDYKILFNELSSDKKYRG